MDNPGCRLFNSARNWCDGDTFPCSYPDCYFYWAQKVDSEDIERGTSPQTGCVSDQGGC